MSTAWDNIANNQASQELIRKLIGTGEIPVPLIAICIPYANIEVEFIEKVYIPLKSVPLNFANKKFCLSKVPSIPVARNALVKQALEINADYIFWLDTDHSFEDPTNPNGFADPNAALKVLYDTINKDPNSKNDKIISGLYRAKQKSGFPYSMWMSYQDQGFVPVQEWTGNYIETDVVGLGCCLMDTRIFKDVPKPWFHWDDTDEISEDFFFLRKVKQYGYNCRILTDIKLSHIGKVKIRCDGTVITPEM
jgi:hypothetical protein